MDGYGVVVGLLMGLILGGLGAGSGVWAVMRKQPAPPDVTLEMVRAVMAGQRDLVSEFGGELTGAMESIVKQYTTIPANAEPAGPQNQSNDSWLVMDDHEIADPTDGIIPDELLRSAGLEIGQPEIPDDPHLMGLDVMGDAYP
jgi:hypothetical protein